MDILLYCGIAFIAVTLYLFSILERSWIICLLAIPFMAILVPQSYYITHMNSETIPSDPSYRVIGTDIIYPDEIHIDRGIYISGNLSSIKKINGSYFSFSEVTQTPGAVLHIGFFNLTDLPHEIRCLVDYNGNHLVYLRYHNHCKADSGFLSSTWDQGYEIDSGLFWYNQSLPNGHCYIDESGNFETQMYHEVQGLAPHVINVDYCELEVLITEEISPPYTTITTEVRYEGTWIFGVLWMVFLFTDIGLLLLFYTTGDLAEMFYMVTKRKE